jgi:hypothetical protein
VLHPTMIKLSDLDKPDRYAKYRDDSIDRLREHRMQRRLYLGPFLTVEFESLETVLHRIQESIYRKELTSISDMQSEIEIYAPLIPQTGTLTAVAYVDLNTVEEVTEWQPKLQEIEKSIHIGFSDGALLQALPSEPSYLKPQRKETNSTAYHLHWHLTPQQRILFTDGTQNLTVIHPGYSHQVEIPPQLQASLFKEVSGTLT